MLTGRDRTRNESRSQISGLFSHISGISWQLLFRDINGNTIYNDVFVQSPEPFNYSENVAVVGGEQKDFGIGTWKIMIAKLFVLAYLLRV